MTNDASGHPHGIPTKRRLEKMKQRKKKFFSESATMKRPFISIFFLINTNGCLSEKYDKTRQNKGFDCKKTLQYL